MMKQPFIGLRARLTTFVLLALLPAIGLILYNADEQRRMAVRSVQSEARYAVQIAQVQSEEIVSSTRDLLGALSLLPEVQSGDARECEALFRQFIKQYRLYNNIALADSRGRLVASAVPISHEVNVADRSYFRGAMKLRHFMVGDYQIGRVRGQANVNLAQPVLVNGSPKFVLFASLDLGWLNRLAGTADLPPGSIFIVSDRNGRILVRYPDPERWLGHSLSEVPAGKALQAPHNEFVKVRDEDGVVRFYLFAPLSDQARGVGAHLGIGIPEQLAYTPVDLLRARNLSFLFLIAVLTLAAAWAGSEILVLKPVRALVSTAVRVSTGDLAARTGLHHGLDELGCLAGAFDEMTDSLQVARDRVLAAEEDKKRSYRAVVRAVTNDRFHLVDREEVPVMGRQVEEIPLSEPEDYRRLRKSLREMAQACGMDQARVRELVQAVGEAATNAMKHAGTGFCTVYETPDSLVVRVADNGPGIRPDDLVGTMFVPGFSTKVSLGMGYSLMLGMSDRVWMATDPGGTVVQLEKRFDHAPEVVSSVMAAVERMAQDPTPVP